MTHLDVGIAIRAENSKPAHARTVWLTSGPRRYYAALFINWRTWLMSLYAGSLGVFFGLGPFHLIFGRTDDPREAEIYPTADEEPQP